jgi:hypothetical protein
MSHSSNAGTADQTADEDNNVGKYLLIFYQAFTNKVLLILSPYNVFNRGVQQLA